MCVDAVAPKAVSGTARALAMSVRMDGSAASGTRGLSVRIENAVVGSSSAVN